MIDQTQEEDPSTQNLDEAIDGFLTAGLAYEKSGDWGEAITEFQKAVDLIDKIASDLPQGKVGLQDPQKQQAVDSFLGILRCRLALERNQDPEMQRSPIPKSTEDQVRQAVKTIQQYRSKDSELVWNKLLVDFKKLEALYREDEMSETAEIFYHWSQVSQMNWYSASMKEVWKPVQVVQRSKESNEAYQTRVKARKRERRATIKYYLVKIIGMKFYSCVTDFRMSLWRPFIVLVIIPWFIFGLFYFFLNQNNIKINGESLLGGNNIWVALVYSLAFSIFNFTGSGPGDITLASKAGIHILTAIEVGWGYFVTVIIISRFINFLTNMTISSGSGNGKRSETSGTDDATSPGSGNEKGPKSPETTRDAPRKN